MLPPNGGGILKNRAASLSNDKKHGDEHTFKKQFGSRWELDHKLHEPLIPVCSLMLRKAALQVSPQIAFGRPPIRVPRSTKDPRP